MDYDKLIERLRTDSLYADKASLEIMDLCMDAATAIETLRAENAKLRSDWEKYQPREHWETLNEAVDNLRADLACVTAERDAAIADWRGFCAKCAWNGKQYLADGKMDDRCKTCRENRKCNWEWHGIKED